MLSRSILKSRFKKKIAASDCLLISIYLTDEIACADPDKCLEFCGNKTGCSNIAYPLIVMRLMPEDKYSNVHLYFVIK